VIFFPPEVQRASDLDVRRLYLVVGDSV
jgi:hypothetical protein